MSLCRRPIRRIAIAAKTGSLINKATKRSISQQNIYTQLEATHLNDEQPQFIREEKHDDAIFKVYFKRIRSKSSGHSNSSSTLSTLSLFPDDCSEQQEPTGETPPNDRGTLLYSTIKIYQLKAGTLERIVEFLTNETGELDSAHMNVLFSTYRTYTNTRTLIETIIKRYRAVLPASLDMTEDVRQKSLKSLQTAIIYFLNNYKEEFSDSPRYSTLNYLIKNVPDRDVQKQGLSLLEELKKQDENVHSNIDNNNNKKSRTGYLYTDKGFDYIKPWNILDMPSTMIAEQLTIVDADLLKRVLPHECLTFSPSGFSRRTAGNNPNRPPSTIDKTIEYFNAVVARVTATILKEQDEQTRAHVIEKWIDVAHQCRKLKNFSSLTAILNGLLSGCIYRLNRAWSYVTEDYQTILEELKNVFVGCEDRTKARAILEKECTTKYSDVTSAINATLGRKTRHKMTRDHHRSTMIGAVPYLGMYLSDLTYIDSAYPKTITIENDDPTQSKKLINFEKHRKEYEVVAQIKLFQSAANAYSTLHPIPRFKAWFDTVRIYTDAESWELSYQIEPKEITDISSFHDPSSQSSGFQSVQSDMYRFPSDVSLESRTTSNNDNIMAMTTSATSLQSSTSITSLDKISSISIGSLRQQDSLNQQSKVDQDTNVHHSRSSSISSFPTSSNGSSSQGCISATASPRIGDNNTTPNSSDNDSLIAKVHFVGKNELVYKKVRIRNDERTTSVLKTILDKFGLDSSTYEKYCIEQLLPDRRILILDHCNVFYALARSPDNEQVDLIVREKTRQERQAKTSNSTIGSRHNRSPGGFSKSSFFSR